MQIQGGLLLAFWLYTQHCSHMAAGFSVFPVAVVYTNRPRTLELPPLTFRCTDKKHGAHGQHYEKNPNPTAQSRSDDCWGTAQVQAERRVSDSE